MTDNVLALSAIIVGLLGGIGTAVVTHLMSAHARRQDADRELARDSQIRNEQSSERLLEARRIAYSELNGSSREFVIAMTNFLHEFKGLDTDEQIKLLDDAKNRHRDAYSNLQMIGNDSVLPAASSANQLLSRQYGRVRRYQRDFVAGTSNAPAKEALLEEKDRLWAELKRQRISLRAGLGLTDTTETTGDNPSDPR